MTLLICRTCPRYDLRATGQFSRDLTDAIAADGRQLAIRKVQCLGGCPDDGVAAVDGPGKTRIRFTGLTGQDAPAIITAALAHQASTTGDITDWQIPPELTSRISSVTSKRQPARLPGNPATYPHPQHKPRSALSRPWGTHTFGSSTPGRQQPGRSIP
jgi:predicted metal-binding protein